MTQLQLKNVMKYHLKNFNDEGLLYDERWKDDGNERW